MKVSSQESTDYEPKTVTTKQQIYEASTDHRLAANYMLV